MKKYDNPIYYIGTETASSLMTIRVYVEEYKEDHNYEEYVCSFDLQDIVKKFNSIRSIICNIVQSPTTHHDALTRLNEFDPYMPREK